MVVVLNFWGCFGVVVKRIIGRYGVIVIDVNNFFKVISLILGLLMDKIFF